MARTSRKNPAPQAISSEKANGIYTTALYLRLSLEDNGKKDADSLENQLALLKAYVADRPYLNVVGIYSDNGCTGTDFDRPEFTRMMEDIQAGKANCIIVKDLSRLGRNYVETGNYLEKVFPFMGVRFIAINDNYDSENINSGDQLAASLKNLINDEYAKDISRKICSAMKAKRQRGEYVGAYDPYGYLRDPENPTRLIIDPEIAPIVHEIFEMRSTGMGIEKMCRVLNEKGYPSPGRLRYERGIITNNNKKGSALPWNRHVLNDLLHNVVYIGTLAQGKSGSCLHKGIPFHWKDASEWDVVHGTHDPIISNDLWEEVQVVNNKRTTACKESHGRFANIPRRQNPYGALLRCPDCGRVIKQVRSYNRNGKKDYYTYKCPQTIELGEQACPKKSIKAETLDETVLAVLRDQMRLFIEVQSVLRDLAQQARHSPRKAAAEKKAEQIRDEIERKNAMSAQLYTDYRSGIISRDEYVFAKGKYAQDIAQLEKEAEEAMAVHVKAEKMIRGEQRWASLIAQYYHAETVSSEMVAAMVKEIRLYSDSSIQIDFLHMDEIHEITAHCEKMRKEIA